MEHQMEHQIINKCLKRKGRFRFNMNSIFYIYPYNRFQIEINAFCRPGFS